jgi:zinc protease
MKKLFIALFVTVFMLLQGVFAQQSQDLTSPIPTNPNVKTGTLPNGLKYYIEYNKKPENKVELRLAVNAGAILEDDSQQGLAHFMEHMNFNGLKNFPNNELVHYLQSIGVAFGNDLNAYTGFDETVYILPVPSDKQGKLDSAFMVLADWSGASLLAPDEIDKERGVILAESRLGKGANDRMMKIWLPVMFNGSKYANRLPIGKDSIIENFDHSVLVKFNDDWYRPDLQAVIVVGDMPVDKAEKLIIEKFSDFKNPENAPERPERFIVKPFAENQALVVSDVEANQTSITISGSAQVRKPMATLADYRENMIDNLCFSMLRSRFNELRNSVNPPFISAYAYLGGGWARGYENYTAGARCGSDGIEKAVEALVTESVRVKKYGFTEDELSRAKAAMLSNYEKQFNELGKTESDRLTEELVNNFFEKDAIPGIEWEYNFAKNNISDIKLADFEKVRGQIDIDNHFFAFVTTKTQPGLPTNDQLKAWIESALKKPVEAYTENKIASSLLEKEPVAGKIIKTEKNDKLGTTTYYLSNKAIVTIKPTDFKNDEVILRGSRLGGFSLYPGTDYQSPQWCGKIQEDMGYGQFSNPDLTKFLSGKIANVTPKINDYNESIDGKSSVKDMETMFQLLYLKSSSPRKDEAAFQSSVSRSKQQLELLKQNPQYLFIDSAFNTFYQGNARAHMIQNVSDFDKINIGNAVSYYAERMGNPNGMNYTIVGSFTEEQILPFILKYIGGMVSADINKGIKDIGLFPMTGNHSFTLHKGTEQQAMLMHFITGKMPFNEDDAFMLEQLNAVLNNKVIDTIREKMSAIYGGGCNGSLQKYPREEFLVQSYFPCSPDNIEKVNTAFLGLIESTKKTGGITEYDLTQAREPALEKNKVDLKLNDYWLNALQSSYLNGTDPERILTREQRLEQIKPEQLVETARKFYTDPSIFKAEWLPEVAK